MPGHVKRGGTGEPDPDPTPFLYVSFNEKQKDMAKVYAKKYFEELLYKRGKGDIFRFRVNVPENSFKSLCPYFQPLIRTYLT